MRMPVMGIRIVVMNVRDWSVLMPVRVAGPGRNQLFMTMVVVDIAVSGMNMFVHVCQGFMLVPMFVPLGEVQADAKRHQQSGRDDLGSGWFAQ